MEDPTPGQRAAFRFGQVLGFAGIGLVLLVVLAIAVAVGRAALHLLAG